MILVSDVDLDLLNELHTYGSVRNLKDRRNDLYEVRYKEIKRVTLCCRIASLYALDSVTIRGI